MYIKTSIISFNCSYTISVCHAHAWLLLHTLSHISCNIQDKFLLNMLHIQQNLTDPVKFKEFKAFPAYTLQISIFLIRNISTLKVF